MQELMKMKQKIDAIVADMNRQDLQMENDVNSFKLAVMNDDKEQMDEIRMRLHVFLDNKLDFIASQHILEQQVKEAIAKDFGRGF